jgi:hypothetical protein
MCSAWAVAADAWQIVHLQPGADVPNPLFVIDECPRGGMACQPPCDGQQTPGPLVLVVIDTPGPWSAAQRTLSWTWGLFVAG